MELAAGYILPPVLFGLFSLAILIVVGLPPDRLPVQHTAWYHQDEAAFSDALAAVRRHQRGVDDDVTTRGRGTKGASSGLF